MTLIKRLEVRKMGNNCYRKGYESGPWYELATIRKIIYLRDLDGSDATFPRHLYFEWLKYPEFRKGDENNRRRGLYSDLALLPGERYPRGYVPTDKLPPAAIVTPPDFDDLNFETKGFQNSENLKIVVNSQPGRPRKSGELSRSTTWRRRKEQGVLL
jgi:hypothetical protein